MSFEIAPTFSFETIHKKPNTKCRVCLTKSIAQSYRIFQNHMTKRYNDIHHLRVKRSYINRNLETVLFVSKLQTKTTVLSIFYYSKLRH